MRKAILAITAFTALASVSTIVSAQDYPYCLQGRSTGVPGDCSYATYAQCMASASGRNAYCNVNPRAAYGMQRPRGRHYRY